MERRETYRLARVLGRLVVVSQVVMIGAGVSVPALGSAEFDGRRGQRPRFEPRPPIESRGDRGHVRRRDGVIEKRSHVEKRDGRRNAD